MAKVPMTATQASQAHAECQATGCDAGTSKSILDWFQNNGITFDKILAAIAIVKDMISKGISWQNAWAAALAIFALLTTNPTPVPVIVP